MEVGAGDAVPIFSMALHTYEIAYLKEMQRDLECAVKWIDDILEIDELDSEDTLIKAALISAYVSSVPGMIQVVIDSIELEEQQ